VEDRINGSRMLILGGSGIIGSRLVEVLEGAFRAEVSVMARNLANAVRVSRFPIHLVHGDVMDVEALDEVMKGKDVVIDCTFPKEGDFRSRCVQARAMARNIGNACLKHSVKRLVHLSTISVYGRPVGEILDENSPRKPGRDAYGASKLAAEQEMMRLYKEHDLPVVVLQPTVVYGPFTGWSVAPIRQLTSGIFVLPNGGAGTCNAVYIDDVVQAIIRAATEPDVDGEVMLVSGPEAISWGDYYKAYKRMIGADATLTGRCAVWPRGFARMRSCDR